MAMKNVHSLPSEVNLVIFSFFHSAVYKCVCQQYSEKLYENLMHLIANILTRVNEELQVN